MKDVAKLTQPKDSYKCFSVHFDLPLLEAADLFGCRSTAFKKRCRAVGIHTWPYRKVKKLNRSIEERRRRLPIVWNSKHNLAELNRLEQELENLMADKTTDSDNQLSALMAAESDSSMMQNERDDVNLFKPLVVSRQSTHPETPSLESMVILPLYDPFSDSMMSIPSDLMATYFPEYVQIIESLSSYNSPSTDSESHSLDEELDLLFEDVFKKKIHLIAA